MLTYPFLFLALSLTAGIWLSSLFSPPLFVSVIMAVFTLVLAWIVYGIRKEKAVFILVLLTALFFGMSLHRLDTIQFEKNKLRQFQATSYMDFYGTLYKSVSPGKEGDTLYLKVIKVVHQMEEKSMSGRLQVTVARSSLPSNPLGLFVRDKIKISAQLTPSKGYQNFTPPLHIRLQKSQRIHNRAFSKSPLLIEKISSGKALSPLRLIAITRQNLLHRIEDFFSDPNGKQTLTPPGAVLEALLLGERGRMDESVSRSLQHAGLYHLFAISGAHIALITFILFSLFRLLHIPNRPSYIILMFILVAYAFLVEGRPSILRATIMALVFLFGKLLWKDTSLLNAISISAFALLCFNPFSLFDAGFQMTFTATLSIVLFFPIIINFLPKLPLRISEIFALTITAQIGVLPILASTFNRVTFSSLILNFAALPLVALIMFSGYLFLLFSFFSPMLAGFLVHALNFLAHLLTSIAHLLDSFSFFSFRIPTPHLVTIIGYASFLFLLLLPFKRKKMKGIFSAGYLVFFAVLITYPFPSFSKDLRVTFIDVGQGESILVEFPGRKKMLIDGGGLPTGTFDIGERVVSPFLWRKGIKTIDYMVLTHPHPDHLNGLISVARNFRVRELWESLSPREDSAYSELRQALPSSTRYLRLFRNDSLHIDDSVLHVLHPEKQEPLTSVTHNDQSMVIRLSYGQTSFVFTGDIGKEAEQDILENGQDISSDVLKSPHHGSISSSSVEFLRAVEPKVIVISVGVRNRYNFPDPEVMLRYRETGARLYRTDHHGAVEISSNGQTTRVKTALNP